MVTDALRSFASWLAHIIAYFWAFYSPDHVISFSYINDPNYQFLFGIGLGYFYFITCGPELHKLTQVKVSTHQMILSQQLKPTTPKGDRGPAAFVCFKFNEDTM